MGHSVEICKIKLFFSHLWRKKKHACELRYTLDVYRLFYTYFLGTLIWTKKLQSWFKMFNAIIEKYLPGYFCAKHFKGFIISCRDFLEYFILNELLNGVRFPIIFYILQMFKLSPSWRFMLSKKTLLNDDCSIYFSKTY